MFPHIGARLPRSDSLALRAQHGKFDAEFHTLALLGTPSDQSVHDCYSFALEDGGRLAAVLFDRMAIIVALRRLPSMGVAYSRSLHFNTYYVRMQHFVR
jgi:hypothetical protein